MLSSTEPVAADEPLCRGAAAFRKVHPLQFHRAFLSEGVRSDGRGLLRARRASVQIGVISTADASAMVHIGETTVLAVVKAHPTLPSETEPGLGRIAVALELAPTCTSMSSSMARGGAVQRRLERQQAALCELLQRTASSGLIALESLCIEEGRAVWECRCVLHVLEHDGNLTDACMLAMACAMTRMTLPTVQLNEEDAIAVVTVTSNVSNPVIVGHLTYGVTFGILSGHLIIDPTADEESLLSTQFTVLLDPEGSFAGLHKPGGAPLPEEVIYRSVDIAQSQLVRLKSMIPSSESA